MSYQDSNTVGVNCDAENHIADFKPLQFPFTKSGFAHELVKREGLICIVKRSRIGLTGVPAHFEVVKLRELPERTAFGKTLEASETYPEPERWGFDGFTHRTLIDAQLRLESLAAVEPVSKHSVCRVTVDATARNEQWALHPYSPAHKRALAPLQPTFAGFEGGVL